MALIKQETSMDLSIGDSKITVELILHGSYQMECSFNLGFQAYRFNITKWSKNGFANFFRKFHKFCDHRDASIYGKLDDDENIDASSDQRKNCIYQATRDVFATISKIVQYHQRSIIEYSIWFRESAPKDTDLYSDYITLIAAHCILHSNLMVAKIQYEDVRFQEADMF